MRRERNRDDERELAPAERRVGRTHLARERRADAAADAESCEEDREDDREAEDRSAEHQGQQPRPDDLGSERGQSRKRDHDVDDPVGGQRWNCERRRVAGAQARARAGRQRGERDRRVEADCER